MKQRSWSITLALIMVLQLFPGKALAAERLYDMGVQAYIYAYPMVVMEVTRRMTTNVETSSGVSAPMNQFAHTPSFHDHTYKDVVRPNADTLYSSAWFDVSIEPWIVSVPDVGDRYYVLQIMDMWTEVFAAPGTRTSGNDATDFVIVGPDWSGVLPDGLQLLSTPTNTGWIIGRIQTNGSADYENVHKVQKGFKLTPLSSWGQKYTPPSNGSIEESWDMKTPPPVQVAKMNAETFFGVFAEVLINNPPHELDWNMVQLLKRFEIIPGKEFDYAQLSRETREMLDKVVVDAPKLITAKSERSGELISGWQIAREIVGSYGTSYMQRAHIALIGLGANVPEDAVYPMSTQDGDGNQYSGRNRYVLHFDKEQLPPVDAFWSLAMYDEEGYFVDNPIKRYSIGDRDELKFDKDGALDIYIQTENPGKEKESNWLPAPVGEFNLTLRLYRPMLEILTGEWNPPAVKRLK